MISSPMHIAFCVNDHYAAVSYTHLDVYKRQVIQGVGYVNSPPNVSHISYVE